MPQQAADILSNRTVFA